MTLLRKLAMLTALLLALQTSPAMAARSLVIWVYVHDDLAEISDDQLHKDLFAHWLDEMRTFSEHPIEIIFKRNVENITGINYREQPSNQTLDEFTRQVSYQTASSAFSWLTKSILITDGVYDKSGLNYNGGLAVMKGTTAIASASHYSAAAHEIGHMLSATHEDAELQFNGWVCETYTHPRVPLRSNCYRYSDKNRENITRYLRDNSN